jgi:hypothetical protein
VRFGGAMDAGQRELVERLLSESDSERRAGAEDALRADEETQQVLVGALAGHILRVEDPEHAIESLTRLARDNGLLVPAVTTALQRVPVLRCLEPHHVPMLAALPGVLQSIVETDDVDEQVVRAARAEMTGR